MRKAYSIELLRKIHQSNYVYLNEDFNEVYVWFGNNIIKIFDYIGEDIGEVIIQSNDTGNDYTDTDAVNKKDVQLTIDELVRNTYVNG